MKSVGYYNQYGYYNFTIRQHVKRAHHRISLQIPLMVPFKMLLSLHAEYAVIMKEIFTNFYCLKLMFEFI